MQVLKGLVLRRIRRHQSEVVYRSAGGDLAICERRCLSQPRQSSAFFGVPLGCPGIVGQNWKRWRDHFEQVRFDRCALGGFRQAIAAE